MREFGVPALGVIDDDATAVDHLFDTLRSDPSRVSFRLQTDTGWQPVTHEEFMRQVTAAAKGLVAIGVSAYSVFGIAASDASPGLGFVFVLLGGLIAMLSSVVNSFSGLTMLSFAMRE